ncbi:biotin--[acetyl-CoA-carboxylase] ligase [Neoasaia chiangmaiensis]|uniref:biotin--[biotin carboxyl-carrier protein] ligase n=1 Tax=Neoasaia chiangmaiensis TaxID=320497 RepID=A0A1U9KMQ0_9PROT|nr:biotin--[acetyl-CoA-carboxylase] ligase [Neoasaia chiangmaiensis]AQS87071.1 hypothetical protein A0U93_02955 [Neoasaia chiangmaiensis]GEN15213.1 biotin--[acetyl-CoA-carboxylase] ligase [Neoasaia chiangmaiensis]
MIEWRLECHEQLSSTSDLCRSEAMAGAAEGLAILAHMQSAGRGTRGRTWQSIRGNLSFSFLLRPREIAALIPVMPFLCSIALYDAVHSLAPTKPISIKWPNDLLLDNRKMAGILIESSMDRASGWIVVGIGANLVAAPQIAGREVSSLAEAVANVPSATEFAQRILAGFSDTLMRWETGGVDIVLRAWQERAHAIGTRLAVQRDGSYITGFFKGLDKSGHLLLQTESGENLSFSTGDVLLTG